MVGAMIKRWDEEHTYAYGGSEFYHTESQVKKAM